MMEEDDEEQEQVDEIEEELIRRLFLPRTESIGSAPENDGADEVVPIQELHMRKEDDEASTKMSSVSLRQTEHRLKAAERKFLSSKNVRTAEVPLHEISGRFKKSTLPENPLGEDEDRVDNYLQEFLDSAVKDSVNTASPSMIGHMTSSLPYFARPLSRLVTTLNQNVVKTETANTITFLEREAIAQLHRQIYHKDDAFYEEFTQNPQAVLGLFTSGGTVANTTALWIARNMALKGVERHGIFPAMRELSCEGACVIGSELLHYSMGKAVDILGLGRSALKVVQYDENFRIRVDLVEQLIEDCLQNKIVPIAIIGIAGATETGSIDDLNGLADIAEKRKIHFHVDAAWGGPMVFSKKHSRQLYGIERADSVTLDGHKQLYMPMGCGLCFLRDPKMITSVEKSANYIIRAGSFDLGRFSLEGSRPANAVYLHANLNVFGVRGYEVLVDRSIRMTRFMARQIEQSKGWFDMILRPKSNILLYRLTPPHIAKDDNNALDEFNIMLQQRQTLRGKTFVSRTTIRSPAQNMTPIVALRVVIANPLTFESDILRVLQDQIGVTLSMMEESGISTSCERPLYMVLDDGYSSEEVSNPKDVSQTTNVETSAYWSRYWDTMPLQVRNLFKNDKELFLTSLVAPDLELQAPQGLFGAKVKN